MLVLQSGKGQNGSLVLLASHPKHRYVSTLDASVVTVKYVLPLPPEEFDGTGGVRTDIIGKKRKPHGQTDMDLRYIMRRQNGRHVALKIERT